MLLTPYSLQKAISSRNSRGWYQGDHILFLLAQRPALALTSERALEIMTTLVHTAYDPPDVVDVTKLAGIARALAALVIRITGRCEVLPACAVSGWQYHAPALAHPAFQARPSRSASPVQQDIAPDPDMGLVSH